jgi:hypothetical protein
VAAGVVGLGFHLYNVTKREGSLSWHNVFYGAPLGSPGAILMAGVFGFSAKRLAAGDTLGFSADGRRAGRSLAALTSAGMAATVAEAFLLHFRGAFQDPFQWGRPNRSVGSGGGNRAMRPRRHAPPRVALRMSSGATSC